MSQYESKMRIVIDAATDDITELMARLVIAQQWRDSVPDHGYVVEPRIAMMEAVGRYRFGPMWDEVKKEIGVKPEAKLRVVEGGKE